MGIVSGIEKFYWSRNNTLLTTTLGIARVNAVQCERVISDGGALHIFKDNNFFPQGGEGGGMRN